MPNAYYADKIESIRDIMGARDVVLEDASLVVDGRAYPIVDDAAGPPPTMRMSRTPES